MNGEAEPVCRPPLRRAVSSRVLALQRVGLMQARQRSLSLFGTWDDVQMTAADGVAFTVVGPTGTYTISAAEHAHWAEIAHRSGASRREALWQAFEQLMHFTWLEAEAAERGVALS